MKIYGPRQVKHDLWLSNANLRKKSNFSVLRKEKLSDDFLNGIKKVSAAKRHLNSNIFDYFKIYIKSSACHANSHLKISLPKNIQIKTRKTRSKNSTF